VSSRALTSGASQKCLGLRGRSPSRRRFLDRVRQHRSCHLTVVAILHKLDLGMEIANGQFPVCPPLAAQQRSIPRH
jgi:hypothetical protein